MLLGAAPDDVAVLDGYFSPPEGDREGGIAYADTSLAAEATPTLHWNHSLGAIVTALVEAGMRVGSLFEMDSDGLFEWNMMVPAGDGMYRMPPDRPSLPLMFMPRARRPETG